MPGLPELDIARVRRWCEQRVPEHVRDQVRVECDISPRHLTILECLAALARGHRLGMDTVSYRPAPLYPGHQDLDTVLARP